MDNQQKLAALRLMQDNVLEKFNIGYSESAEYANTFANLIIAEAKLLEIDPSLKHQNAPAAPTTTANRSFKPWS